MGVWSYYKAGKLFCDFVTTQALTFQEAKKTYSGQKSFVFAKYSPKKAVF